MEESNKRHTHVIPNEPLLANGMACDVRARCMHLHQLGCLPFAPAASPPLAPSLARLRDASRPSPLVGGGATEEVPDCMFAGPD